MKTPREFTNIRNQLTKYPGNPESPTIGDALTHRQEGQEIEGLGSVSFEMLETIVGHRNSGGKPSSSGADAA